ncbi:MAG: hypothetical protein AB1429_03540 [Pseudomonadota bacterium]
MSLRIARHALLALALAASAARAQTALDRYGGGTAYAPPIPQPSQQFLNWPGKVEPAAPAVVYVRPTYAAPAYTAPGYALPAYVTPTPQTYPRTVLLNGPPAGYAPQGYVPQGYMPQAYVIAGQAPQGSPPMAQTPQVYGQQVYAPTSYVPQAIAPTFRQPVAAVAALPPASYTAQASTPTSLAQPPAAAPVLQSEAEAEAAAAGPALPNSIYAPPPPSQTAAAPPPQPVGPNSARFYSVHRDYGLTPDAIPVAPEVFGPTADLTQPETPDAPTSRKGASKGAVNADRLAQAADGPSSN